MRSRLLTAVAVALAIAPAAAQQLPPIRPGTRVRVFPSDSTVREPWTGTVVATRPESLTVASGGVERTVAASSIGRLEMSRGRSSHALTGALVGAVVGGAALGAAAEGSSGGFIKYDTGGYIAVGAGLGALLGAGVGALIRTERWEPVHFEPSVAVVPSGTRGLAFRFHVTL